MLNEMILETKSLTRRYGRQLSVDNLDLQIERGSIYGFLGPNGAGKTTTIRMLLGLVHPTEGTIRAFGMDLDKRRTAILRKVGSLVESPSYYGHLTGFENLSVIGRILGVPKQRVVNVLDIVRLTDAAHRPVKGYSLGMKQRLGIAMALLGNPELLVLDEPTNGLDPAGIHEIRELIVSLPRTHGITVLVSSHLLSEIDHMATQVGIINKGRLVFQGPIETLRTRSAPHITFTVADPNAARRLLQQRGMDGSLEDGKLWLDPMADSLAAEINKSLVLAGIPVFRIEEVTPSLEDIFLDLVGKGNSL